MSNKSHNGYLATFWSSLKNRQQLRIVLGQELRQNNLSFETLMYLTLENAAATSSYHGDNKNLH